VFDDHDAILAILLEFHRVIGIFQKSPTVEPYILSFLKNRLSVRCCSPSDANWVLQFAALLIFVCVVVVVACMNLDVYSSVGN